MTFSLVTPVVVLGVLLFFVAPVAFVAAVIVEATETLPFELMMLARGPLLAGGGVAIIIAEEPVDAATGAAGAVPGVLLIVGLFEDVVAWPAQGIMP